MKHLLLMTAVLCLSFYGFSQDDDVRTWIVGGAFNYSHDVNTNIFFFPTTGSSFERDRTTNSLNVRPSIARVVNPRWTIGLAPSYSRSTSRADRTIVNNVVHESIDQVSNSISIAAFARYTLNPDNRFNIYLRPNLAFSSRNLTLKVAGVKTDESILSSWSTGIGIGFLYQLSDRFNITTSFGGLAYRSSKSEDQLSDRSDTKSKHLGFDFQTSTTFVGFEYKL